MSRLLFTFSACLLWVGVLPALALWPLPSNPLQPQPVADEILVAMEGETPYNTDAVVSRFADLGVQSVRRLVPGENHPLGQVFLLRFAEKRNTTDWIRQIAAMPGVRYAEPNVELGICLVPNDPYYASAGTWGQEYDDLWGLKRVGLLPTGQGISAWDAARGDSGTFVVAVIDTGLDAAHEDIAAQVWTNPGEIAANGLDDDGNGYVDDLHGWDFTGNDNTPHDGHGHGTHCAGTIGARTNNGVGIAGINWDLRILPLKGLNDSGSGTIDGLAEAIVYAADNGARVLSNSWGGVGTSQTLADAVAYAVTRGCLVVAAAGNMDADLDAGSFIPASYPNVLAVAATDSQDRAAIFTNYGAGIDLSAPGVDVLSLRATGTDMYGDGRRIVGQRYYRASGTSMACPHVAGVAALVWSAHPEWTAGEVWERLLVTADDIDGINPRRAGLLGTGRVNAAKALLWSPQPNLAVRSAEVNDGAAGVPNGRPDPGESFFVTLVLSNNWLAAQNVHVDLRCDDPYLTILSGHGLFGTIPQRGHAANVQSPFLLSLRGDVPPGRVIDCTLEITADHWTGALPWALHVAKPELWVQALDINDASGGDGDRFVEAGETAAFTVTLGNSALGSPARAVTIDVEAVDPQLTVLAGTVHIGDLLPNGRKGSTSGALQLAAGAGYPTAGSPSLRVVARCAGPYTVSWLVRLGLPQTETTLWQDVIDDPWGDLYFSPLEAEADKAGGLHLLWQDFSYVYGFRFGHGHWRGGWWTVDENLHWSMSDWRWSQHLSLDQLGRPSMGWSETRLLGEYSWENTVHVSSWDYTWDQPVSLVTAGSQRQVSDVQCRYDSRDQLHLVWFQQEGQTTQVVHAVRHGGLWGTPSRIATLSGAQRPWEFSRLARGPGVRMILGWRGTDYYSLYIMEYDGATWTTPRLFPTQGHYVGEFDILVDQGGRWHVTFGEYAQQTRLYTNSTDNFATLHTLLDRVPRGFGPRLSQGPDGTVHFLYSFDQNLFHRTWRNGTLSAQETVPIISGNGYFFSAVCIPDANNALHYVYQRRESGDRFTVKHLVVPGPALPSPTPTATPTPVPNLLFELD